MRSGRRARFRLGMLPVLAAIALLFVLPRQPARAQAAIAGKAIASKAAPGKPAPSPIETRFRVQKLVPGIDGKESLEDASSVATGDVVQYSVQQRNISSRRLLKVDFGIPIPPGTTYVEGSASPEGAMRSRLDKRREQMMWRVEKLEPGDTAVMSLRVRIDPDPTLTPLPAEPRKPEFRRQPP